jgi:hypothetical protein
VPPCATCGRPALAPLTGHGECADCAANRRARSAAARAAQPPLDLAPGDRVRITVPHRGSVVARLVRATDARPDARAPHAWELAYVALDGRDAGRLGRWNQRTDGGFVEPLAVARVPPRRRPAARKTPARRGAATPRRRRA